MSGFLKCQELKQKNKNAKKNKTENKLTVHRERKSAYNITTILKDSKGKVKKVFSNMLNQPRKGTKTIVINERKYKLDWWGVE